MCMVTRGPTQTKKKTVQTIGPSVHQTTAIEAFLGGCCWCFFLTTWIASIACPVIIGWALLHEQYMLAAVLIFLVIAAYAPWEKGFLSNNVHRFVTYFTPCYIKSLKIVYEGGQIPNAKDPQTLFAVHPHGAFCIGW
jgi:hypothetical protein